MCCSLRGTRTTTVDSDGDGDEVLVVDLVSPEATYGGGVSEATYGGGVSAIVLI